MEKVINKYRNVRIRKRKVRYILFLQLTKYCTSFLVKLQEIFTNNVRLQLSIIIK